MNTVNSSSENADLPQPGAHLWTSRDQVGGSEGCYLRGRLPTKYREGLTENNATRKSGPRYPNGRIEWDAADRLLVSVSVICFKISDIICTTADRVLAARACLGYPQTLVHKVRSHLKGQHRAEKESQLTVGLEWGRGLRTSAYSPGHTSNDPSDAMRG